MSVTPTFKMPAEWMPHRACWLAWPYAKDLWQADLEVAQESFASFCRAIADVDPQTGKARGENLEILVANEQAFGDAKSLLGDLPIRFHRIPYGDIWLRDIAPLFVHAQDGTCSAACFHFNGWGEKYVLEHDSEVAQRIAAESGLSFRKWDWVFEGGAIEVDGQGTGLTSRSCLLNPNRNPGLTESDMETRLKEALGLQKIIWITEGLLNDHTDGHIDTIARFVAPGVVACMFAGEPDDPNKRVLEQIRAELESATDANGQKLRVVLVPSPGRVLDEADEIMPASYLNFYIANTTVVVPTYESRQDIPAVETIRLLFPKRKVIGIPAKAILTGGGAFHCISQQEPVDRVV